jgi:hypothetical protein
MLIAKTPLDVVRWIDANSFHDGAILKHKGVRGLRLAGHTAAIFISSELASSEVDGLYEPSDFDLTGKMFQLTEAGRALLNADGNLSPSP